MQLVSRTVYSSYLQTVLLANQAFKLAPNSTLNELYGVQNGVLPPRTPSLGYFAIGNGGHRMTSGADGVPLTEPVQHEATDSGLIHGIPFVLRAINNDIGTTTQANYALRRIEVHGGAQYIAYYLKRLPMASLNTEMILANVANGVTTISEFIPTSANLNPTPQALASTGVNLVSGDYVAAQAAMNVMLSATEVGEIINAATIMYGKPEYAIISEIALCSGVDKIVQSPTGTNAMINFNEAIAVQCLSFISSYFSLMFNTNGVDLLLDIGCSEPLFNLSV